MFCVAATKDLPLRETCRRLPRDFLEEAAEMVRVLEPEEIGNFADPESLHQETLCLFHHEVVDVADGGPSRCLVDQVAEISRGICQGGGAVRDGGDPFFMLQAFGVVVQEKAMEALEDVAFAFFVLGLLPQVDAAAVFQDEVEVARDYAAKGRGVLVPLQFLGRDSYWPVS